MSLTHPPRYPGPPPPPPSNPNYPYPHRVDDPNSREPQHVLPPMSSLLPRHERMEPGPAHNNHPYPPPPPPSQQHSYPPPPPPDSRHPLWLAESNPTAPIQHIYHQAQPHPPATHSPHYRQDPVSNNSPTHSPLNVQTPHEYPSQPAPQRQHRRISQRSDDTLKDAESPASPIRQQNQYQPPPIPYHPQYQFQGQTAQAPSAVSAPPTSPRLSTTNAMHISGLLSANPGPQPTRHAPPKYTIRMRQQPLAARACGFGERDRRVIDPPPILQMTVEDPNASSDEIRNMIRQPCAVVHCTLWDPVADKDDTAMPGTTDKRQQRRLMGTLVSSPFVGKDEHGIEGCFFTFPDLSVRTPGKYSLRFSLMIIDPTQMCTGNSVPVSSVVFSDPFNVYNAKDFGGMRPSTELTKRLKHQGCLISVKKGNAKTGSNAREEEEEEEEEDDDELDGDEKKARRPSKRAKR